VILCAHGTAGAPGEAAFAHARSIRDSGRYHEVAVCCLKGQPNLAQALAQIRARPVHLVPLLMADGYTSRVLLPAAIASQADGAEQLRPTPPIGVHPAMAGLIARTAHEACVARGWRPADSALVILGHGTARDPGSADSARAHAQRLASHNSFASVAAAFLEQPPSLGEMLAQIATRPAVVVGYFAERGVHGEGDARRLVAAGGPLIAYAGPIGCVPGVASLILDLIASERE